MLKAMQHVFKALTALVLSLLITACGNPTGPTPTYNHIAVGDGPTTGAITLVPCVNMRVVDNECTPHDTLTVVVPPDTFVARLGSRNGG